MNRADSGDTNDTIIPNELGKGEWKKKSEFSLAQSAEQANVTEWLVHTFRFENILRKHPSPKIPWR